MEHNQATQLISEVKKLRQAVEELVVTLQGGTLVVKTIRDAMDDYDEKHRP